jgi:hypothetical protein
MNRSALFTGNILVQMLGYAELAWKNIQISTENTEKRMAQDQTQSLSKRILERLSLFFGDIVYTVETLEEELDNGNVMYKPSDILPYLQTAFIDEKFVEVEINGITQVYFSRVHDHPPDPPQNDEIDETDAAKKYNPGDYLKKMSHLIMLPLEPGMGNYNIRYSNRVLLRFFTSSYAVEVGTFYQDQEMIQDLPVLRLDYPVIARIVRGSREFRAKVPKKMDIKLMIIGKRKQKTTTTQLLNVSVSGFAFAIRKEQQQDFVIDEQRSMEIIINDMMELRITGTIRHISKIRGKKGTEFHCGVQADLPTRAVAARLEEIVATVQRAHLRELAELSTDSGITLIR